MFCPTTTAVENLRAEGLTKVVRLVGDVMYDVALYFGGIARRKTPPSARASSRYYLAPTFW